jgi:pimeloyl-ACP methyl ester carboxylesterase
MYDDFDDHTRRAVLELYRSVPDVAAAGERLAAALRPLDRPALVLWGRHDPYLPAALADRQRDAFPHAEIRVLECSGHWPFIDDHETTAAAITTFLARHAGSRIGPDPRPRIAAALKAARHAAT